MEKEHGMAAVEASESKFEKAMQERHKIAVTGYRLEQMVWGENPASREEIVSFVRDQKLPKSAEQAFERLVDEFEKKNWLLDATQKRIEDALGSRIEENPTRAGEVIFRSEDEHRSPEGKISLQRKPGFFLLEFESAMDFARHFDFDTAKINGSIFCGVRGVHSSERTVLVKRGGLDPSLYQTYHLAPRRERQGIWQDDKRVPEPTNPYDRLVEDAVPVIGLHSRDKRSERIMENTLHHERQHDIFEYFSKEKDPFNRVLDELLARIRGSSDAYEATDFFQLENYWYVRQNLSETQKIHAEELLKEIRKSLIELEKIFPDRLRAILTYHLMDVRLEKISTRLTSIQKFYERFLEPVFRIAPPASGDYQNPYVATLSDILLGIVQFEDARQQGIAQAVVDSNIKWEEAYTRACEELIIKPDAVRAKKLAQELATLKQVAEKTYADYLEQDSSTRVS